jgi:hypothetical protein
LTAGSSCLPGTTGAVGGTAIRSYRLNTHAKRFRARHTGYCQGENKECRDKTHGLEIIGIATPEATGTKRRLDSSGNLSRPGKRSNGSTQGQAADFRFTGYREKYGRNTIAAELRADLSSPILLRLRTPGGRPALHAIDPLSMLAERSFEC